MLIHLKLGLDRVEDLQRSGFRCAHNNHELAVAVKHRPDGRRLGERGLAAAARHRKREEPALEDGFLDLGDCPQMVIRPRKHIHFGKVGLAKESEVLPARRLAFRICHLRQLADVSPCKRLLHQRLPRRLAPLGVAAHPSLLGGCRVELVDQPRAVFAEVDAPLVLVAGDAEAAHLEVAVHLRRADDGSEGR